jgi:DNA-binding FadR family transcriptional regulator
VERFQVSRPIVREALRTLQGQRIIRTSAGKGAVLCSTNAAMLTPYFRHVMQIAEGSPTELMAARAPIEIAAARLAATARTEEDLSALADTLTLMEASLGDPEEYAARDTEFHILLARASGNTILSHIIESMHDALQLVSATGLSLRNATHEFKRVQELHDAVLKAVAAGDPAAAGEAMDRHFIEAQSFLNMEPTNDGDVSPNQS